MEKTWLLKNTPSPEHTEQLKNELNLESRLAFLLAQRGIQSFEAARDFFRPELNQLHDPFLMKDMDLAVDRLSEAIHGNEKILLYGDYDVDGTTAVTLVYGFLSSLGVECLYYIPDRYSEGYGFSFQGVDYAKEQGCTLIITLDCGVRDGKKIDYARTLGIDVVVCDHHLPAEIPRATAVLDPKRPDCPYPYKGLSGAGVGFKMLQGLCVQQSIDTAELFACLDLVTISIGADIVPLTGENRILAFHGLKLLQQTQRPGIAAMLLKAGFKKPAITITDVVFILAPRINAAGRIFSGKQAVELLLSEDHEQALTLSVAIEEHNATRKEFDKDITAHAIRKIDADNFYRHSLSTVVFDESWHKGVVGIVASRLVETYYKPTIVLVSDGEKMAGSARSIQGIDLFECLSECEEHLIQFGGHTMAAGLTLKAESFNGFRDRFDLVVREKLNNTRPTPFVEYDTEIEFTEITPKLFRILKQFEPFGPENLAPVFLVRNVRNSGNTRTVGDLNNHLKLHVHQEGSPDISFDGIGFDLGHWADTIKTGSSVDLLFALDENTWKTKTTLQLVVKDIRNSENATRIAK
jgi:single-stranded-DNA-specific exonuclease